MLRLRVADYFFVPELPVAVLSIANQDPMPVHRHEFAELTIVTGGNALHVTPQGRYPITAGDVFFIPPETPHGFASCRRLALSNVLFLPGRAPAPTAELQRLAGYQALFELEPRYRDAQGFVGHLRLPADQLDQAMALVRELEAETKRYAPGGATLTDALFAQLIIRLSRSYGEHSSQGGRRLLAVQKTIRRIETGYAHAIELEELARAAGMSLSTFKRAFKAVTGTSPIDYLLKTRLARACGLLRESETTVTEAALATGFNDSNYFARQFRRRMGCTPGEWRESQSRSKRESGVRPGR